MAERVLRRAVGVERVRLARDSYTYIHFPMVGGIVFASLGAQLLIADDGHTDAGRYALYGGLVSCLCGHLLFRLRNVGSIKPGRATVTVVLLVLIPLLGALDSVAQIAVPAAILIALVVYEISAYRDARLEIRTPVSCDRGLTRLRLGRARDQRRHRRPAKQGVRARPANTRRGSPGDAREQQRSCRAGEGPRYERQLSARRRWQRRHADVGDTRRPAGAATDGSEPADHLRRGMELRSELAGRCRTGTRGDGRWT